MADSKVILERRYVPKGSIIFKQGDDAFAAFLIQSGAVTVYAEDEDGHHQGNIAELGAGQIFGEMALVVDKPRTASVKAKVDCNLIVITRQAMEEKLRRSDPTVKAIVEMLVKRVASLNEVTYSKYENLESIERSLQASCQRIMQAMPGNQQSDFEESVLPKMEAFLVAINAFNERFGK